MLRVAINGFGRIGRMACRALWGRDDLELVAINDLAPIATLSYLLTYDSNYGTWNVPVSVKDQQTLRIAGQDIPVFQEKDPTRLPWERLEVDVVLECTGLFLTQELAMLHVKAGARHVVLSAPAKDDQIPTYVYGVNARQGEALPWSHIVSNASCTTNAAAPILAVLDEYAGVASSLLTTVHSFTASQALVDSPKQDLREGRSAVENMIPTTTGAARAVAKTLPQLSQKCNGISVRVPLPTVSLLDVVAVLRKPVTVEELANCFTQAAQDPRWRGILATSTDPCVSSDFKGSSHSCTIDIPLLMVVDGTLVKIVAWYDNEWGYAHRLIDLAVSLDV